MLAAVMCSCDQRDHGAAVDEPPLEQAILQLGRPICGDCCLEQVHRAFEGMEGIGQIHMSPGDVDFSVELRAGAPSHEDLVAALVAAGASQARISPEASRLRRPKQWVVAR